MTRRSSATTATPTTTPALADGTIPQPGDRVTHADGTRGAVEWTVYNPSALAGGRATDDPVWCTLVRHEVDDQGRTACRWRRTAELHREQA